MKVNHEIHESLKNTHDNLAMWIYRAQLYEGLFYYPDSIHAAVPAGDRYTRLQHELAAGALFMSVEQRGDMFVTIAKVAGAYALPGMRKTIRWVVAEETEDRGQKTSVTKVSFKIDELGRAVDYFDARGVPMREEDNGFSVRIPGARSRLAFTDVGADFEAQENATENGPAKRVRL